MLWLMLVALTPIRYLGAPEPSNEETRAKIVDESGLMDMKRSQELDRLTTLLWSKLGCTFSQITVVNREKVHICSQIGDIDDYTCVGFPKNYSFCSWMFFDVEENDSNVLVIENALNDPRFADNPAGSSSHVGVSVRIPVQAVLTYFSTCFLLLCSAVVNYPKVRAYCGSPIKLFGFKIGSLWCASIDPCGTYIRAFERRY